VSDITPETCSLSWRPPLDDGGSPITNYVVEKLDPFTGVNIVFTFYSCMKEDLNLKPSKYYSQVRFQLVFPIY
jgi:Fibronectin type III domain.